MLATARQLLRRPISLSLHRVSAYSPVQLPYRHTLDLAAQFKLFDPSVAAFHARAMATAATLPSSSSSLPVFLAEFATASPPPFITKGAPLQNLLPGYQLAPASPGLPPYAVYSKEIIKSPNDDRSYRLILLENGMEVLLISDPTTDKSSASMDVRVGHLNDPEDLQGLAHFCEHLMFMGTEKYPKENDYTEYLTQNAGSSNAFTGMDQTCYYFDVHPSALSGALDRFAQFFISPLFDASCTEREANAVNSENSKNLQSDMWRFFQLDKSTSSREHSFWRFGTGNKETLWDEPSRRGEDVRARLIEWQEKHYSANLMKLVVLGKDGLDEMTKEVVEKFSSAQNRHLSVPHFDGSPLTDKELRTAILVKSVKDQRSLELTFPFPDESPLFASRPGSFLSHLIGHEGPGSVLSYLKSVGWANGISAGAGNGANGFEFFKIHVDLTKEGLDNRDEVAAIVFRYIDLVKSTEPQRWAFDELTQLSSIAFRFKEKAPPTSTAMHLSLQMSKPYPRNQLLSAPYLSNEWRPDVIKATSELINSDRCRLMIASQEPLEGHDYNLKEKWYGTEYTIIPMPEKLAKAEKSPKDYPELALPRPNSFIPTNLDIFNKKEVAEPAKRPLNLRNTPTARLWYKKDDRWWVPRAGLFYLIRSPLVDDTAFHQIQSRFFTELVKDALVEYSYDADLAGLSYTFDSQADGIVLSIDGYNDKLHVLAHVVLEKLSTLKVDPKRFVIIKDQLKRAYLNHRLEQPYNHCTLNVLYLTQETHWTVEERLVEIDRVTPENLQEYIGKLLARLHVETLVHGNVLNDDATKLGKLPESIIGPASLTPEELRSHRALVVPEGKYLERKMVGNPENANSAVEQFTYVGDVMDEDLSAKLMVFAAMVQEPLFDQLRTKEQLGYIVSSGLRKSIGFQGLRVIVQSERDASFVESRIDAFWDDFKGVLEAMSDEEVEKYKMTVINQQLEDHKNMWQESSHLWLHIHAGYYDWEQKERLVAKIRTLKKEDFLTFFKTFFFDLMDHRIRRLSSHVRSHRLQADSLLALAPALRALQVPVDEAQLAQFAQSQPTLESVKRFSAEFLAQAGKSPAEVAAYMEVLDGLGVPPPAPEGVTVITDALAFRQAAKPGPYAFPATEYLDLFPAKM